MPGPQVQVVVMMVCKKGELTTPVVVAVVDSWSLVMQRQGMGRMGW
jgi:hypothetical protein